MGYGRPGDRVFAGELRRGARRPPVNRELGMV
ncbi:MAG: hypothetical protein RJB57_314, partial [Actinomycetota bacterium]